LIRIDKNDNNDTIVCDVCLGDDDAEGDEIIICELCNVATHQSCYGGDIKDRLPLVNSPWFCDRCKELLSDKRKKCTDIKCKLCPDIEGIMKKLNDGTWAHVGCVNWTPEIWFTDDMKNKVSGNAPAFRSALNC
jgi:NuA3 HAT complex component NTO1